jgi:LysR family transcriptional regulator, glycine cleavage system transcriptional activator
VFVAVAEQLQFTRAAEALGVTVSAASMQIQALERYLGEPLFRRHGRLIELTEQGARLLPKIRQGLGALQDAIDDARSIQGRGPLRISMLSSFLMQWLMPRLPAFEALHAGIELRIETSVKLVDFRTSEVHAAIRLGDGNWPGLNSEKVLDEWLVAVCHPALLAKLGPVNDPADLKRYRLLHSSTEPWSSWLLGMPAEGVMPPFTSIDDSAAIVRAAEAGNGLALARWSLVADDVKRGRLAIASENVTRNGRDYYFVCPAKHCALPKVVAFHTWLRTEAARQPAPGAH